MNRTAMKIEETHENGVTTLHVQGKWVAGDGCEVPLEAVERLLVSGDTKILLDLEEVPYIDSAGIGELVRCHVTVSDKNGDLRLKVSKRWFPKAIDADGQLLINGKPLAFWIRSSREAQS